MEGQEAGDDGARTCPPARFVQTQTCKKKLPGEDAHRIPVVAIIDTFKIKVKRLWENHGKGKQVLAFA